MATPPNRTFIGMAVAGPEGTGGLNAPPMYDGAFAGTGDFISDLSTCKAQGARVILKVVGAPGNYQNADLSFNFNAWKSMVDTAAAKTNATQIANFVADGTLLGINLIDDAKAGSAIFGGNPPTLAEMDSMSVYQKTKWPAVNTCVRIDNIYLKQKSDWTSLDFAWCQWHRRFGNAQTWLTNNVNDGRSVGLGTLFAYNLLNGGSGITAPWNQHPNNPTDYGMSPQELDVISNTLSQQTFSLGALGWAQNPLFDDTNYYNYPSIQTALEYMVTKALSRGTGGAINWRDKSPSGSTDTGSGSTVTITGGWTVVDEGTTKRKANSETIDVLRPEAAPAGNLQCLLFYSRDSARSFSPPSDWSTAATISGNSAQGGSMVLFYKLGQATEETIIVDTPGTSDGNNSIMGRWFAFSHNTNSSLTLLLAGVGSAKSWTSQTGMGVIPGVTSDRSDALVLICAGRANDFGGGSTDENVMSATTGPETWNRLFSTGNGLGLDSGMFVDWAATAGIASITSKSWSQTSGSQGGAGCGFMVAFAPLAVVGGTPPAMDLGVEPDIALSVGSHLSFTLVSTGSTPITYSKVSGPSNITLGSSSGAFEFTPTMAGAHVIVLRATNSFGSDTEVFTVTASSPGGSGSTTTGSNSAPVIVNPGNKLIAAHDLLSFIVAATDADQDPLTYTLETGSPSGARIDSATGQFIWSPTGEQGPGTYPIIVKVTDGTNLSRSTFTVTVTDTAWTRALPSRGGFSEGGGTSNSFRRV
jgi:hypothetical protein